MDIFNAFKGIEDDIGKAVDATMPRQAVVVRPDETGVWVRFAPVDTTVPEMWFPSTISGLPAGTSGWVHPLAGGKGRFIADGVALPVSIPFRANQTIGAAISTTSTSGDPVYAATATISLPRGLWTIDGIAHGTLWRSVNGGARVHAVSVDGDSPTLYHDLDFPALRTTPITRSLAFGPTVTVSSQRNVTVRYGFRGGSSAGETFCSNAVIYGIAHRIGDP